MTNVTPASGYGHRVSELWREMMALVARRTVWFIAESKRRGTDNALAARV